MKRNIPKNWKEITKKSYEKNSKEFASFSSIYRGKLQKRIDYFSSYLPKGSKILDVGCGAGRDASYFSKKGLSVVGIDISKKLIEIARKKAPREKFMVMDFEKLRFPKNSFDGIWASASLVHVPKDKLPAVLLRLNKILKTNGLFFSSYRVGEGEKMTKEKRGKATLERLYTYYKISTIKNVLHRTGFKGIKSAKDFISTGNWVRIFAKK